jgi:hypothetical protein
MNAIYPLLTASALAACCATATAAAPAPALARSEGKAKARLEVLKKRLPAILGAWKKQRYYESCKVLVRVARLTSPAEAKITLLLESYNSNTGQRETDQDQVLTIYLCYYDGAWTCTRFKGSWEEPASAWHNRAVRFLLLAIDESGGN